MGALKVSENLSGEINTLTPRKEFEIFITAEAAGDMNNPSGEVTELQSGKFVCLLLELLIFSCKLH